MQVETLVCLLITLFLIIFGLMVKKSKFIFFLQIIWMWILIGLNIGGNDYNVHLNIFENATLSTALTTTDGLYALICAIFKDAGTTFVFMNSIATIIGLFFMFIKLPKFTDKYSFIGSLLLIYPLIENIIQKRNFIASSIIILAFYIFFEEKKNYKLKSFILICIATQLHSSAYVYFIFWFLQNVKLEKLKKYIKLLVPIAYLCIPIIPKIAGLFFQSSKVDLYFYTLKISLFDAICWTILHIIFVIIISIVHKQSQDELSDNQVKFENNVYKLNLISLLMLPLYYYEPTFIRIFRNLLIFDYIVIANRQIKRMNKNNFTYTISWCSYLIVVYLMVYVFTGIGYSNLVEPEFINNIFISWLVGG